MVFLALATFQVFLPDFCSSLPECFTTRWTNKRWQITPALKPLLSSTYEASKVSAWDECSVLSFVFCSSYLTQGCIEPGVYPRGLRTPGVGQSGLGAKLSHTHTYTYSTLTTHSHTSDYSEMPINLQGMFPGEGNRRTWRIPLEHEENMQNPCYPWRQEPSTLRQTSWALTHHLIIHLSQYQECIWH